MAEHDITPEVTLSKAQCRYQVSYVSTRNENSKTHMTTYYSRSPSLHLKGDWLKEAGFDTGTSVTVKISEGCIVLMVEANEEQELREQLYQVQRAFKGIKSGMENVLNDSE